MSDAYKPKMIYAGSVWDIRIHLQFQEKDLSIEELQKEIEAEKRYKNRSSVIKMFESAIKRKLNDEKAVQECDATEAK